MIRDALPTDIARTASDDLLTTGEAARLLNTSRQPVVNLCNQGDLPYTTVGTHRRIRRRDLELIRNRSNRLSRDQRRSLWLSYAVAGKIVDDPEASLALARQNLATMRESARGQARHWLDEWEQLIDGPLEELLVSLVSPAPRSCGRTIPLPDCWTRHRGRLPSTTGVRSSNNGEPGAAGTSPRYFLWGGNEKRMPGRVSLDHGRPGRRGALKSLSRRQIGDTPRTSPIWVMHELSSAA